MTVKEIITRLSELSPTTKLRCFDQFGNMYTSIFDVESWRGSYDMPASLVYSITDLDQCTQPAEAISNLQECEGVKVCGYKGGEYILREDSTLFLVGDYSTAGDAVGIKEIYRDGYMVLESNMS